ncbi:hypothetical protein G7Y79_00011g030470 [Physcia stellaris]|nr:hypothetical protein G7Y79_00011g030470 [Physcia stellaris]
MNALSNDIITAYDGESKRISKTYKTKAKTLNAIFKRRASIEQNIAASIERLNSAYNLAAKGLQVTVTGRIRVAANQDGAAESPKADP